MQKMILIFVVILFSTVFSADSDICKERDAGSSEADKTKCTGINDKYTDRSYACCWVKITDALSTPELGCYYMKNNEKDRDSWITSKRTKETEVFTVLCSSTYLASLVCLVFFLLF